MGNVLYDGAISGTAILATIPATISGQHIIAIPYANGMRVLIIG